ncbi:hypothetical protein ETD86_30070 [Nonomuraea turkmeniaca]|uniref:Uncharacterized protein n=1 Tax=Nonomuraea turkmeniaca TaxID=103838 RepID=A0A5S4F9K2_9ACTN|nr:hypothetical protein [Nonomuraea turkmeniaca]TMR13813.1 hypothetical protein ETD86_30070 [Nonomuraea turkmeniaca]
MHHQPDDRDWFELHSDAGRGNPGDLSAAQEARLGYSAALAALGDELLPLIETTGDSRRSDEDFIRETRRLVPLLMRAVENSIALVRLRGGDWQTVANGLGTGHDAESAAGEFEDLDLSNLAGDPGAVWRRLRPRWFPEDPRAAAQELDDWARRHAHPDEAVRADQPVSAGL